MGLPAQADVDILNANVLLVQSQFENSNFENKCKYLNLNFQDHLGINQNEND